MLQKAEVVCTAQEETKSFSLSVRNCRRVINAQHKYPPYQRLGLIITMEPAGEFITQRTI